MSPAVAALFVLFNGQNLDGWKTLRGEWEVRNGAIVCLQPGAIRSSFESSEYTLECEYQLPAPDKGRVRTGVDLSGQGGQTHRVADPLKNSGLEGHSTGKLNVRTTLKVGDSGNENRRGFILFEADEPGMEIRKVTVSEPGFHSLFDGRDIKQWEPVGKYDPDKPNWVVENGALTCKHKGGSWLRTLESYDNFVLRLEYWLPVKGNSGIYLHAPATTQRISQIGQEIQLIDDANWGKIKPSQRNGAVYAGFAPEVDVPAPANEWHAIEIFFQDKRVRTTLNGVQLYDRSLDDEETDAKLLKNPLSTRRLTGFIGLQDHTGGPRFRNIRIRTLPVASAPARETGG
jgi:hypothetical protein